MMIERNGTETEQGILIFDVPEEKGLEIIIPVTDNMKASVFIPDDEVEKVIQIMQNKLNARGRFR